jgi:hypothetical protein
MKTSYRGFLYQETNAKRHATLALRHAEKDSTDAHFGFDVIGRGSGFDRGAGARAKV